MPTAVLSRRSRRRSLSVAIGVAGRADVDLVDVGQGERRSTSSGTLSADVARTVTVKTHP